MTFGELIVYNSTLNTGEGTVAEHLHHVLISREVFCGIDVNVTDLAAIDISDEMLTVDFTDMNLVSDINTDININLSEDNLGVNI